MSLQASSTGHESSGAPFYFDSEDGYLRFDQLSALHNILAAQQRELSVRQDELNNKLQELDAPLTDSVDELSRQEEVASVVSTRDRSVLLLKQTRIALRRMKSDDFGYCESCGNDIGFERLEAMPTATKCIHCKSRE